ncbi:ARM repeat-containing protein [Basidiobolus meristosporus CBS 931.73]|uniref:ARM repeat-containing protein n=1 Tax=Basidiobolus meristosporus CBS 931.73 TaxID=1314790 RepID=A0A1Y1YLV5_9FUNG|nr:ARM repeat-containing protein [Basidiobolus meristosporus CBS 931.73]|eukprot:ORX98968.1 ARM repeat-containing protein [Basidiobolus meristosporus CBS 931.73]
MSTEAIDRVLQALSALYGNTDSATKEEANIWLEDFQKTTEAWTTADVLIRHEKVGLEARLFAAQTFRAKITYDLKELDTNARNSLRDSLLNLLHQFRAGPNIIITQLCLSIANLALQANDWEDPVKQLIQLYASNPETAGCLLEFLSVLPEEISGDRKVPISDEDYQRRSKELLASNSGEVLQLLVVYMQNSGNNVDVQIKLFKCLYSWLKTRNIHIMTLHGNPLLDLSFEALNSEDLFDVAVDVVCEIIDQTSDIGQSMPLIEKIYPKLTPLRELMKQIDTDDGDKYKAFCRIFTEAGEAYLSLVVENFGAFRGIIEGIVECVAFPSLDIVPMTFNFWFSLANQLSDSKYAQVKPQFFDIYRSLIDIIIGHLHYPQDLNAWTAEQRDDFRNFRHEIGDVLKDCCYVLGSQETLSRPYSILVKCITDPSFDRSNWQVIEAPLMSLRSMGAEVDSSENVVVPEIMKILPNLPLHSKIRYAATLVIARYTFWTAEHPEFIPFQLDYISAGFDDPEVVAASAMALKYLCKDCNKLLIDYLNQLHPFYISASKSLSQGDLIEITEALAHVISAVPMDKILSTLQTFCLPIAQGLHEIARKGQGASESEVRQAGDLVDQIATFFQYVIPSNTSEANPLIQLISELWPVCDSLLVNFGGNVHLAENISKYFKCCVVYYRKDFLPLLPNFLERLVETFDRTGLGCYLWVAKKTIDEYSGQAQHDGIPLLGVAEKLSSSMFRFVKEKGFQEIPDVVEDYFQMMTIFIEEMYTTFVQSPLLMPVFQCGMAGFSLEHHRALSAIFHFYTQLFTITARHKTDPALVDPISKTLQEVGASFVGLLINGLIHSFPLDFVSDVGTIMGFMAEVFPSESRQWVAYAINQLPAEHLSPSEREAFFVNYDVAVREQHWRRLRRLLNDFTTQYRRKNFSARITRKAH